MNGRLRKKYKPRQCTIPEEIINKLVEALTERYLSYSEVTGIVNNSCKTNREIENILGILEARGYLVTQDRRKSNCGYKTYYCIMTKEKYEKIEEEHRENAKRRLLAAVSY